MAAEVEVPAGPVQVAPGGCVPFAQQRRILVEVLAGMELGAWDERMVDWLAGWDTCTVLTIASWIARARGIESSR